jgi:type IV pilus assembly protein PilQ
MIRMSRGGGVAAILLVALAAPSARLAAASQPEPATPVRLVAVKAVETSGVTSLELQASGAFRFTSYQPRERTVILDLTGVVSERASFEAAANVPWIAGYRLLPFRNAAGRPVLRLDISLKRDCAPQASQPQVSSLSLSCGEPATAAATLVVPETPAPMEPATAPAAQAEPVRVGGVTARETEQGLLVEIQATGAVAPESRTLSNPARLVVDLPQSVLVKGKQQLPLGKATVKGVRLAQFQTQPPVTRVVVDMSEMVPYEITPTANGVRVLLRVPTVTPSAPAKTEPVAGTPAPAKASEIEKPLHAAAEPVPVEAETDMAASLAPLVTPSVRPPTSLAAVEASVAPAQIAPAQAAATPASQRAPKFTGEPISVNLKDIDLKDFFRLIHEISGLNIVVDPNVSGSVTLVLIDVPWDQALDIVLRNNSLGSTLEGNLLRIATLQTLKKEQEEARDLAKARAEAVDPVQHTVQLSYAQARDLEAILKRFLSSRGEIIRDDRTNTLIIRDIPTVIPSIDDIVKQLDRKSLQVEIEARVVSASRGFTREFGSQLAFAFGNNTTGGRRSVFGGGLGDESPVSGGTPTPPLLISSGMPLVTNFPIAATSGILFAHRSPNAAVDVILTAAEDRNIAKVLSKPRIITQNNIKAEIKQGTRIPVQTVVNNTISTQFIDVALILTVKPQITAEGTVFLDIDIKNDQIDAGIARINGIPALATQATTTQVLVPDGGTVVIGGVMVTNNSTAISQVPLLGSIPVIGNLFKSTRIATSTQELLFFITPRILQG